MNKTHWITKARCTKAERQAIDVLMHVDGLKYADALRQLVREGAKHLGIWRSANLLIDTPASYSAKVRPGNPTDRPVVFHYECEEYPLEPLEDEAEVEG